MSAEDALSPALIGQRPPLVPMRVVCGSPGRVDVPVMLVVHVRMGVLDRLMRMLVLVVLGVRCSQTPTTIWRPAVTIAPRRAHSCNEAGDRLTPGVASDSGSDFVGHSRIPSEECTACIGHIESVRPPFGANGYLRSSQVVQGRLLALGVTVGVAIAYFLAVRLGLALLSEGVAVFWPAAGIAVGVLVTLGRRARAAVVIGVVAATIAAESIWTTVFKSFCNAGEAVLTAWLIEQWFGGAFAFDDVRHVLGFMTAAGLAYATPPVPTSTT